MNKNLPLGMMDQSPEVVARFRKMVAGGESPRMAEILACRRPPRLETATTAHVDRKAFMNNHAIGFNRMQQKRAEAKAAGIPVTDDSFYNATIADERGAADPDAWLHPGDGKDKLRRAVRDKGGSCESLGVEAGESQERMDKAQKRAEKQVEINQKRLKLKKQLKRDGITNVRV